MPLIRSKIGLIVLVVCCTNPGAAQSRTPLERQLATDIQDFRLDDFSHIEAAFILSGATHPDSLAYYLQWYQKLLDVLNNYHLDRFDRVGSAGKVFAYLHETWLKTYEEKATTLLNVVKEKQFNCVAGTILFNLICEDLGWQTEAFETPTHTYTIFPNFTDKPIMIENTTPMGFNIMQNLKEYSRYLLQFYPENRAAKIGFDRLHEHEMSQGRKIDNTELLGLLAYNRAYLAVEEFDYQSGYDFVLLAQEFNKDSRSNVNFEIDLYYRWGKKLFDEKRYQQAFRVFIDAYQRYWEYDDFLKNSKAAFFNALAENWNDKNWSKSDQLFQEIFELDIIEEKDMARMETILLNWGHYLHRKKRSTQVDKVFGYLRSLNPDNSRLEAFENYINSQNNR